VRLEHFAELVGPLRRGEEAQDQHPVVEHCRVLRQEAGAPKWVVGMSSRDLLGGLA